LRAPCFNLEAIWFIIILILRVTFALKYRKLSLVMPVYNEEGTLEQLITKVLQLKWPLTIELVCINDASRDRSKQILQKYRSDRRFKLLDNPVNLGKSRTVKKGILNSSGDLVVIQDTDLEYDPVDLLELLKLFQEDKVDIVYGNRFGRKNRVVYWSNWLGNRSLSTFSSIFTWFRGGFVTSDMETGYKMVRGDVFRMIAAGLSATSSFGFEPELTARLAGFRDHGKRLRFKQTPISYYPRTLAEGKKMKGMSDGIKAFAEIVRFNLVRTGQRGDA
jgi:glycosyltransferase involved in cell wall biosynthesis